MAPKTCGVPTTQTSCHWPNDLDAIAGARARSSVPAGTQVIGLTSLRWQEDLAWGIVVIPAPGGTLMDQIAKGTRVTGEARDSLTRQVMTRYQAGESIRSIAATTGRSYGFIHRLLSEGEVELRGRGGATRRKAS